MCLHPFCYGTLLPPALRLARYLPFLGLAYPVRSFILPLRSYSILSKCYLEHLNCALFHYRFWYLFPNWRVFSSLFHYLLHFNEKVLLGTQNGSWAGNPNPSNEVSCVKIVMFHGIASDQGTSSTKASFTVNRNCPFLCLHNIKKFIADFDTGGSSISKKEVVVVYTVFGKAGSFISFIIEPNDTGNS